MPNISDMASIFKSVRLVEETEQKPLLPAVAGSAPAAINAHSYTSGTAVSASTP